MAEAKVQVVSGVSWLHDKHKQSLDERAEFLKSSMAHGLPYHEYLAFVGRYRECVRQLGELAELFTEFYQSEAETDEELEELTDE